MIRRTTLSIVFGLLLTAQALAANIYVSASGTGVLCTSWLTACTTLATGASTAAAGDNIFVDSTQNESQASAMTVAFTGTAASPNLVYCVNAAGSVPPVSADLRTTCALATTGAAARTRAKRNIFCIVMSFPESRNVIAMECSPA